ncbi:MAG TPA: hypothetical protein DCK76_11825 [Desulfotomaculum sp.]|nr:hypothetical protein [Desulfotomaculum sp.]
MLQWFAASQPFIPACYAGRHKNLLFKVRPPDCARPKVRGLAHGCTLYVKLVIRFIMASK